MNRLVPICLVLALCGCSSAGGARRPAQVLGQVVPATITQAAAVENAAARIKWTDYTVSESVLETVSPYGATPRLVWRILIQQRDGGHPTPPHALVWVDAYSGAAEVIPCD